MALTSFFSSANLKRAEGNMFPKCCSLQAPGRCQECLYDRSIEHFCPLSSTLYASCSSHRPYLEGTSLWSSSSSYSYTAQMGGCDVQVKWSIPLPWLFTSRSKPLTSECVLACVCCLDSAAHPVTVCSGVRKLCFCEPSAPRSKSCVYRGY